MARVDAFLKCSGREFHSKVPQYQDVLFSASVLGLAVITPRDVEVLVSISQILERRTNRLDSCLLIDR